MWRGQEAAGTRVARPRGCWGTCGYAKRLLGHVWRGKEVAGTRVARPRGRWDTNDDEAKRFLGHVWQGQRLLGHMWLDPEPWKHKAGRPRLLCLNELGKSVAEPQSSATHSRNQSLGSVGLDTLL